MTNQAGKEKSLRKSVEGKGADLDCFLSALEKRNPGEAEFHDAVREFMETVYPESSQREDLCRDAILERLVEPDRIFNVKGANLAAFERIAAAMLSLGVN